MTTTPVTPDNFPEWVRSRPHALLLADAPWNHHKNLQAQLRKAAAEYPGDDFAFGELTLQGDSPADDALALQLKVMNVPAVVFFYQGTPSKTVIGDSVDLKEQVRWFLEDIQSGTVFS